MQVPAKAANTAAGVPTIWSPGPNWAPFDKPFWPPYPTHERCRVANRWYNSSFTEPHHLLPALCFWVTTGWPPESVHDFLAAIRPAVGWEEEWVSHPKLRKNYDHLAWRRNRADYGEAYNQLLGGTWGPWGVSCHE